MDFRGAPCRPQRDPALRGRVSPAAPTLTSASSAWRDRLGPLGVLLSARWWGGRLGRPRGPPHSWPLPQGWGLARTSVVQCKKVLPMPLSKNVDIFASLFYLFVFLKQTLCVGQAQSVPGGSARPGAVPTAAHARRCVWHVGPDAPRVRRAVTEHGHRARTAGLRLTRATVPGRTLCPLTRTPRPHPTPPPALGPPLHSVPVASAFSDPAHR